MECCACSACCAGRIDQVHHLLILDAADDKKAKYEALDLWRDKLATLHLTVVNKIGHV